MLPDNLQLVHDEYHRLHAQVAAGQLTQEQLERGLRSMMAEHQGCYWTIGAQSGKWYKHDGTQWIEAAPPDEASPADPLPPPPSEPRSDASPTPLPSPPLSTVGERKQHHMLSVLGGCLIVLGVVGAAIYLAPGRSQVSTSPHSQGQTGSSEQSESVALGSATPVVAPVTSPASTATASPGVATTTATPVPSGSELFVHNFETAEPITKPLFGPQYMSFRHVAGEGQLVGKTAGILPAMFGKFVLDDFILECDLRAELSGTGSYGLIFRAAEVRKGAIDSYYMLLLNPRSNAVSLSCWKGGKWILQSQPQPLPLGVTTGSRPVRIKVEVIGSEFTVFADSRFVYRFTDYSLKEGRIGLCVTDRTTAYFDNFRIYLTKDDLASSSPASATSAPATAASTPAATTGTTVLNFSQIEPGFLLANAFNAWGISTVSSTGGNTAVNNAERGMVLPPGHTRVLNVRGNSPETSLTFYFAAPIRRFAVTRIGANPASLPTWRLEALDANGRTVTSLDQERGATTEPRIRSPRSFMLRGQGIYRVRLTVDNRSGGGTWATYNSLPITEVEFEKDITH